MIVPSLLERLIVLVDVGAIGTPPSHWLPLKDNIHLIGFEPNEDECLKLNESECKYKKSEFLPYAIGERNEKRPFYITEYNECCSLLKPNFVWLNRFDYGSYFNLKQIIDVETLSLDSIEKFSDLRVDALKIDAQGNELPILQGAESMLKNVFLIEVECGLHKNYENETTFEELAPFLKQNGFICMEAFTQPSQKRNNIASKWNSSKGQAMACESIWVRDLIKCETNLLHTIRRSDFLSILSLCWLFRYSDYALELLDHEYLGTLLNENDKRVLRIEESWLKPTLEAESMSNITKLIGCFSHILPTPARRNLYKYLPEIAEKPNILKKFFGRKHNHSMQSKV
jgi:FkbM family methyltransferase